MVCEVKPTLAFTSRVFVGTSLGCKDVDGDPGRLCGQQQEPLELLSLSVRSELKQL